MSAGAFWSQAPADWQNSVVWAIWHRLQFTPRSIGRGSLTLSLTIPLYNPLHTIFTSSQTHFFNYVAALKLCISKYRTAKGPIGKVMMWTLMDSHTSLNPSVSFFSSRQHFCSPYSPKMLKHGHLGQKDPLKRSQKRVDSDWWMTKMAPNRQLADTLASKLGGWEERDFFSRVSTQLYLSPCSPLFITKSFSISF